jgi:hypothetical protein
MELGTVIEFGTLLTTVAAVVAAFWAFRKWRARDELFPRVEFNVAVNFIGAKDGSVVCELVAVLENKGVTPIRIRHLRFLLRGLERQDKLEHGGPEIRGQLNFTRRLIEGDFVPDHWDYTFVYPGARTRYSYAATIPIQTQFVRMQGDFEYVSPNETHHAAKVLAVPMFETNGPKG